MRGALLLAGKDLRQRLRDRSAIIVALVLPFALAFILNLTLGNAVSGDLRFTYAFADADRGPLARSLRVDVLGSLEKERLAAVTDVADAQAAARLVDRKKVSAAIIVPAGFSQAVQRGGTAELHVIGDVDERLRTAVARSLAQGYATRLDAVRVSVAAVLRDATSPPDAATAAALAGRASALPEPITLADITASKRELDARSYFAAGMAVFFLFFTVQLGVSSLLDERKEGTLRRLLAAPVRRGSILGGKLLTSFVLGVASMAVLVVSTTLLIGARWGDPAGVALLIVAGVVTATAIMALVATFAKTSEQAGNWQSIVALVLGMLGGSFFPIAQAGGVFEKISLISPHAWFLRGLADLAGGAGPGAVLPSVGAMLVFAAIVGAVAAVRIPRMAEP